MKKTISLLLCFCLAFCLCGCDFLRDVADSANGEKTPKTFDFEGISMELTNEFLRMDFISEKYDFVVGNEKLSVMGIKMDSKESNLENLSVLEFAKFFRELMKDDNPTEVTEISQIPTMQYTTTDDDGENQTAAVMFYKGTDCFWIVCFVTKTDNFEESYEEICGYAKTVVCE